MNAATTTQLLLTLFDVEGVLHPGIAGNADSSLMIGDVTIAKAWAHLGLLYWQVCNLFKQEVWILFIGIYRFMGFFVNL